MKLFLVLALTISFSAFAQKSPKEGNTISGVQSGGQAGIQSGAQAGGQGGVFGQAGAQSGAQAGAQAGGQAGVQAGGQAGAQGGNQGGAGGAPLPNDPMAKGCGFLSDDDLATQLLPGRATLQALRDEVARLNAATNASTNQSNQNCSLLGQQVQNLLDHMIATDDKDQKGGDGKPAEPDNKTFAQRCLEERQRGNASCACDPVACRARIQAITTQAASCGESREGMIDAITGVALRATQFLGPVGSMVGLGISVVHDILGLFKKKKRSPEADKTQVLLNRNLACVTSKTWYNTMCADTQVDQIMEAIKNNPPKSSATCSKTPTESANAREALGLVYQCMQDGRLPIEQCLACNPMKLKDIETGEVVTKVYSPDDEEALREEIGRGATTDLSIRQNILPDMLNQAREYHKAEVQRLYQNIKDGYVAVGRQGNQINTGSFKAQEYRQLIRHCYLGYLSEKIVPPQLDIIQANPRDREFSNICNQLDSCLEPRPDNMFGYDNFEKQGRSLASTCAAVYSLERQNSALRIDPMRRLLSGNMFGESNGCGLNKDWKPNAPGSSSAQ